MIGKLLVAGITVFQLSTPSYGCSTKLLDEEVDMWTSRVWSGNFISEQEIKNSLNSLYNLNISQDKCSDPNSFDTLYTEAIQKIKATDPLSEGAFFKFASHCENLYAQEEDPKNRVGVYTLLEKVTHKYLEQIRKAKSLMPHKFPFQKNIKPSSDNFSDALNCFKSFFDNSNATREVKGK